MKKNVILLTGAAGFIGSKTAQLLIQKGYQVVGIDNLNDYYDVRLKQYRLKDLKKQNGFIFHKADIEDLAALGRLFKKYSFCAVINLAARAGVRYSIENPHVYLTTNTHGNLNLLECCRAHNIQKFVLASTSSLYAGQEMPFKETLPVNTPISPYAASKKGAEMTCYTYHYLFGMDVTILRYFTVYGPAGRPDMSVFRFIKWIDEGKPIELFGDGNQSRDFTYVDDIARGTIKALKKVGFKVINLGGDSPYKLNDVIGLMEKYLGKQAEIQTFPFHKADMLSTWADVSRARDILKWRPRVGIEKGIKNCVEWARANPLLMKNVQL